MSAAEIIELIKKLPPEERAEVFAFAEEAKAQTPQRPVRYIPLDEAKRVADKIFTENEELFRRLAQ
jgi:hypothetical protein